MTGKVESADEENGDIESGYFSITATAQEIQKSDEVHKVPLPQNKRTFRALKHWSGECFFPDDPLHNVKKQKTVTKKTFMVLQYLFPVLIWGCDYSLELLKSDAIAGLTIASLAIPQGISYAKLAYLPPIYGLCEFFSLCNYFISFF
ncbi:putative sulfate transporter 3.4 [Dendrobium catenatum]|uniref:Putative sulfate transporter 3.4 n=1 Tax=Dendrobium catenatum TaxID=906689 RepID=A0A2I0W7Q1_9ASPA|nr:putative sulfate transporter 3.4 [Dendrobium catenatum]